MQQSAQQQIQAQQMQQSAQQQMQAQQHQFQQLQLQHHQMNQMSHQLQQQAAAPRPAYGSGAQASGWQHCTSPPVGSQQLLGTTSPPIPQASPFVRPPYPQGCGTMKEMYVQGPQAAPLQQQQQQQGAGGYPLGYGQRPQTLPLQDNAVDVAPGTPSGGYRGSIPPPQQGAAYGYRRPPRYPYPSQLSPVATPSPQVSCS